MNAAIVTKGARTSAAMDTAIQMRYPVKPRSWAVIPTRPFNRLFTTQSMAPCGIPKINSDTRKGATAHADVARWSRIPRIRPPERSSHGRAR